MMTRTRHWFRLGFGCTAPRHQMNSPGPNLRHMYPFFPMTHSLRKIEAVLAPSARQIFLGDTCPDEGAAEVADRSMPEFIRS